MFILYSRLLDRIDKLEQRLADARGEDASPNTPDPQTLLNHIAEVSKNARATWFGLLGLLAFFGVTLLAHKDADFFAYGAETQLPLIGITVPVKAFFYTAPILVAALYMYLHLYLLNLWDALAQAPAKIDNQPLGDRIFPWLISHAALWHRNRTRIGADGKPEGSTSPRPMGRFVVFISLTLGAVFGIVVLGLLWLRSMPAHDEWLTLWIGLWLFLATLVGITGLVSAARRMAGVSRHEVSRSHGVRRGYSIAFALTLAFLSWETTEGGILNYRVTKDDGSVEWAQIIPLYPAKLREAELTRKPPGWLPWHLWREDFEEKFRRRKGIAASGELPDAHKEDFEKEAKERYAEYTAQLDAPNLRGADLRSADMALVFAPGADLREAKMQGADLSEAQMQGADLSEAQMQGANLSGAQMQGADLSGAQMQGANLSGAQMQGADLRGAKMQGADLRRAKMQGANLSGAQMQGADLSEAKMQGADLRGAKMQGADLSEAKMQGADLSGAQMQRANLFGAKMQGADLSGAQMQGANLFGAKMQGADLSGAQMQRANLGGAKMQGADLFGAEMQGADLGGAQMQGANLSGAQMQGADLRGAQMQGADLRGAQMQGADLRRAKMQGADLSGAQMQDADCRSATLRGALLQSADVTCLNLTQDQLEQAVGDSGTALPDGLTVVSCLETLPQDVEAALAHHPEEGDFFRSSRADIRDALLCDPG